jgi:hypothetical protein
LERDSMNGWINGQVGGRQGYVNVWRFTLFRFKFGSLHP